VRKARLAMIARNTLPDRRILSIVAISDAATLRQCPSTRQRAPPRIALKAVSRAFCSAVAMCQARKARPVFKARSARPERCAAPPTSVARRRDATTLRQCPSARQRAPLRIALKAISRAFCSAMAMCHARKARPVFKVRNARPARCAAPPTSVARCRDAASTCQWSRARQRAPPRRAFKAISRAFCSAVATCQARKARPAL